MHHAPRVPPLSVRVLSAVARWSGRGAVRRRSGRPAMRVAVTAVLTAVVLAVPVVGGSGSSPAVVGSDPRLLSSGELAGVSAAVPPEPPATGSVPGGTAPPAPDPAPAVPVAPRPVEVPAPEAAAVPETTVAVPAPAVAAAEPAPAAAAAAPAPDGGVAQVLALVNTQREAAGCGPLAIDAGLVGVAQAHSEDMRDREFFDHVNLEGLDPFDRADRAGVPALAENIARGQVDAADAMTSWMDSPGHRANIVDCRLTRLGVGVAQGGGGPWWTQLFG
ncbi:MAG: hypothetical protein JWR82_393 [Blastococcus sp.]|nr:hypothetical protein [Blastococcus sp.]